MPDDHDEAFWEEIRAVYEQRERAGDELLATIKARLPELRELAEHMDRGGGAEDLVYRFWHHSFKVYWLQEHTLAIVAMLEEMTPEGSPGLDKWFQKIVRDGTGHEFELDLGHNEQWLRIPRRIVEAYFHARWFLDVAIRYGEKDDDAAGGLESGWAAILELYGIR